VAKGKSSVTAVAMSSKGDLIVCADGAGSNVCLWNLSMPKYLHETQMRLEQARNDLMSNPSDGTALAQLVTWYTALGMPNWAQELLDGSHSSKPQ
jgi:hypothetical protein